jgi:cation diffusion facilitator CzcD-associated flavoprotein CzcO
MRVNVPDFLARNSVHAHEGEGQVMNHSNHDVIVIGTGFAGLGMGIKLKKAGITNFTILERSTDVGGTWRDNHYPGAACDVASHLYSFSFEPNLTWSRMFSPQAEILAYIKHCAKKYGLLPHIRLKSNVIEATFDDISGKWTVRTDDGQSYTARFLITGTGGLSRPSYPNIPGIQDFSGDLFHSAAWNHSVALEGKRVAVIGTGASAIQIVPSIAGKVGKLHLFQRSAAWILPKRDFAFTPRQQWLKRHIPFWERGIRLSIFWRNELFGLGLRYPKFMNFAKGVFLKYLEHKVKDPELRAKLTPNYAPGCKRILLSDEFYAGVSRDNVDLVTAPISHISAKGIVTKDGKEHVIDTLICATGFQASEAVSPFPIRGRQGRLLADVWDAKGAEAYRGTTVSGFPNLFFIVGPNTGLGHTSMVLMIESQVRYVVDAIRKATKRQLKFVDVYPKRQEEFNTDLQANLQGMVWTQGGCVSWYQTASGKITTLWPKSTIAFSNMLRHFDLANYHQEPLVSASKQDREPPLMVTRDISKSA